MKEQTYSIPNNRSAVLVLSDGTFFFGKSIGYGADVIGEICFNTSITGYQEVLTDPSYTGQIITFTFPHIGNIGTNQEDSESTQLFANGLIVREDITSPSNFRSHAHLNKWLKLNKVSGICGVDTRNITRHIRVNGAQNALIHHFKNNKLDLDAQIQKLKNYPSLKGMEIAEKVTTDKPYKWNEPVWSLGKKSEKPANKYNIVVIDYGVKSNILRCLASVGCNIKVVSAKTKAQDILNLRPDGIFLSNGPGDPYATGEYAVPVIKQLIESGVPIFGICLGHQLIAKALGCITSKMHQGHRGANHPVQDIKTKKVEITSQNHGFVVVHNALPDDVEVTHISLFDNSIEGIKSKTRPVFSVQYHPESSPGPHDSSYLFKRFANLMDLNKRTAA